MRGVLAGFESEQALEQALGQLASADIRDVETYTPMPLGTTAGSSSPQAALGSPLPLAMFVAGMLGFIGFFLLMTYADVSAYPLDIGGRPKFAWPAFVPIAFELGVLCAMATGFFGFFFVCRMPQLYDPVDECASLRRASRDGWFVAVRCDDLQRLAHVRTIIEPLRPASIEEFAP